MQITAYKTNQDIPKELLLGYLSFTALDKDIKITKDQLEQKFQDEGLDRFLPELELRDHDVFRRATSGYQNHVLAEGNGEKKKLLVREIQSDSAEVVRMLVREHVKKGDEPQYDVVATITLDRNNGTINHSIRNSATDFNYGGLVQEIKDSYQDLRTNFNKESVSNLITRITNQLRPVSIIPNGRGKFVPGEHNDTLEGLKAIVETLDDSTMELIPLINTEEQRDLVEKGVNKQTQNEMNQMIFEVSQILSGKEEMTKRKYKSLVKRAKDLQENVKYYEDILYRKSVLSKQFKQLNQQLMVLDTKGDE